MRPTWFLPPVTAGDRPPQQRRRRNAPLPQISTSLFGSSSRLSAPGGKCSASTALLDRGDEAVAWAALLYSRDQRADRRLPHLRRHLGVDARVRHDLGVALGHRGKDQHAGAVLGAIQALGE